MDLYNSLNPLGCLSDDMVALLNDFTHEHIVSPGVTIVTLSSEPDGHAVDMLHLE
jgi:hypothetical protein